jgi:co-chaperonin GroES (HSP10)
MKQLEALFDAVIVKPLETEETQFGSIFIPDAGKDRNEQGTVIAVGPGNNSRWSWICTNRNKSRRHCNFTYNGILKTPIRQGEEYFIGNENQILARIKQRRKMSKVIEFGADARKKLVKGIDTLADAVVATLRSKRS